MRLEVLDPELFKRFVAPFLPSTDYYELRSRFDNLRDTLPAKRYMNWPSIVQEIVNADISMEEADLLSQSLRITPVNDMDSIRGCWSLVHLFLQNETCADCVKRSFLVLPVIHAAMRDDGMQKGRLEDLIVANTSMVIFVGLYSEDYDLIEKVVHLTGIRKDEESFMRFSRECFAACVIFDKIGFCKQLLVTQLILPIKEMGSAVDIFTTVMSPKGLAAIDEPIPNNPFVPGNLKSWIDFLIEDCMIPLPGNLLESIVENGCIRSAIYFVEDRRVLMRMLYARGNTYADFLGFAACHRETNPNVVEYFENLPYTNMGDMSILSACAYDELQLLRILLESTDPTDIDFDACYRALEDGFHS